GDRRGLPGDARRLHVGERPARLGYRGRRGEGAPAPLAGPAAARRLGAAAPRRRHDMPTVTELLVRADRLEGYVVAVCERLGLPSADAAGGAPPLGRAGPPRGHPPRGNAPTGYRGRPAGRGGHPPPEAHDAREAAPR